MRIKLADVYESTQQALKSHGNVINVILKGHSHHNRAQPSDEESNIDHIRRAGSIKLALLSTA